MKRGGAVLAVIVILGGVFTGCAILNTQEPMAPPMKPVLYEHYYYLVAMDASIEDLNRTFQRMKGWELPPEIAIDVPDLDARLLHFRRPILEPAREGKPPVKQVKAGTGKERVKPAEKAKKTTRKKSASTKRVVPEKARSR